MKQNILLLNLDNNFGDYIIKPNIIPCFHIYIKGELQNNLSVSGVELKKLKENIEIAIKYSTKYITSYASAYEKNISNNSIAYSTGYAQAFAQSIEEDYTEEQATQQALDWVTENSTTYITEYESAYSNYDNLGAIEFDATAFATMSANNIPLYAYAIAYHNSYKKAIT